ncbi:hypothetical protein [Actinokineospora sp. NBRC 105648]|uniref:hypothetical protein n=1 Tax=Actinokineospora sp. NBRC 105648 TaxID=3032206 RepID=UPI0025543575|nr:hypothetical protein [Actinokineospora sp. NBRC 105648]
MRSQHDRQPAQRGHLLPLSSGNNNRGRPDKYEGHPATVYMREDLIINAVHSFVAERVFGQQRRQGFLRHLPQIDDSAQRDRHDQLLRSKLADITRKQDNSLRQAEDADPRDPFTQGLRQRYNDLDTERQALRGSIVQLDARERQEPARPGVNQVTLLDALPHLASTLTGAPEELLDRLFDLTTSRSGATTPPTKPPSRSPCQPTT